MADLIYNEPFEPEEWAWKIGGDTYLLKKHRQIDCEYSEEDHEGFFEYDYDFMTLSCFDEKGTELFTARTYCDEDEMHFLSRPNGSLKDNERQVIEKIKKKFHVIDIRY
ncbi:MULTISPECIES: hypothetical protein [unclassified Bacillus (in: firmicutes)]|uniref:hypothetical protein n=1 Tax=unclassified Bacillus (in: firmicutes) TaxID=185979 RepID=UPI0004146E5C|nr:MULTISPECIES: hypothetical protein [unclassified Bacillus (in: firmicutes)]QHZ48746.1 hypothetical protein M654_022125 [Bacillus sp. NSP9.1]WFA05612.1 hypothetical protein P3X63_01765 [Bacillus sp. HSf4]